MRKVKLNKLVIGNINGYLYPVIICDLEGFDKSQGYLTLFREKGFQISGTIAGEWDLLSYYFPEDPVKDHLESKLGFFSWLEKKGHDAVDHVRDRAEFIIDDPAKDLIYNFCRAAWVAYANSNRCGKRVSEEDFRWFCNIEQVEVEV